MSYPGATAKNVGFLSRSDQGGRPDGTQVMVHKGYAYVGHMFSDGITAIDVRDPRRPAPVAFIANPPNTRSHHIQAHGDILLAVNGANVWALAKYNEQKDYFTASLTQSFKNASEGGFESGLRVYDISRPEAPREIAFIEIKGLGLHRIWWLGGRYAYASAHMEGFTDHIMAAIDMSDPAKPRLAGRWWLPGMWQAGGEEPRAPKGKRWAAHHAIVAGNLAYGAWRDGGLTVHDVSDPTNARLVSHTNWCPPFAGGTHTPLPLPDRNLLVVADEATSSNCANGIAWIWVIDVRAPENPISIATLPTPMEEDFCAKGGKFGPHNLHENRPGALQRSNLIFATYHNAGLRVFDIGNPFAPREVAYFVPPPPEKLVDFRPNTAKVIQSCDVFVDANGVMYMTDTNAGLYILQYEGK
ncbi:MAG: LVIVD repeat-containing protein [Pseudolabrys sp.]